MKKLKIALFHPWLKSKGGAEKVVLEFLKNTKHDVDVYTWIYDKKNTFEEFKKFKIKVIAPKIAEKFARSFLIRGLAFFIISLFSKIPIKKYDKFLISTGGLAEFITFRNYKKGQTYAYIHTPLREVSSKIIEWNLKNRYKGIKKYIYLFAVKIYLLLEKLAWRKVDYVIFNSELSKSRAEERSLIKNKKFWIVYPPIKIPKNIKLKRGNYLLYVSRFNPPKRQKELVLAFKRISRYYPNLRLMLVGSIDNKKYFEEVKKLSENSNIEIRVNVSDKELNNLYSNCLAGIFVAYQEDFGIVPLEVIGRGKPLIAVDEGGYVDLIKNNPLFYKIKEKHDSKKIIIEIEKALKKFLNSKKKINKVQTLKFKNFAKEIDKILEKRIK